jgi:hypothetical protein
MLVSGIALNKLLRSSGFAGATGKHLGNEYFRFEPFRILSATLRVSQQVGENRSGETRIGAADELSVRNLVSADKVPVFVRELKGRRKKCERQSQYPDDNDSKGSERVPVRRCVWR